jgi:hypothetical protein
MNEKECRHSRIERKEKQEEESDTAIVLTSQEHGCTLISTSGVAALSFIGMGFRNRSCGETFRDNPN